MPLEIKDDIGVDFKLFRFQDAFGKKKVLLDFVTGFMVQNAKKLSGEATDGALVKGAGFQEKEASFIEQVISGRKVFSGSGRLRPARVAEVTDHISDGGL